MTFDCDDKAGGVTISGDKDELGQLRDSIDEAIEHGKAEGLLLTGEGTTAVSVWADG